MTVKMSRLKNIVIILLLCEIVLAILGHIFISSSTSLTLLIYIFVKNIIIISIIFYAISIIKDNNMSVTDEFGDDSKNALKCGGIGLNKYE